MILLPMERFMSRIVERTIIKSFLSRKFNPLYKFDVGTLVDLSRLAGGMIPNKKTDRTSRSDRKGLVPVAINKHSPFVDLGKGKASVKVVAIAVKRNVFGLRKDFGSFQNPPQPNRATTSGWIDQTDIVDLPLRINLL